MGIVEGIGWIAMAAMGIHGTPVADAVNKYNDHFATKVDRGASCFDRIGGEVGEYGGPGNYSLDLVCNYRLKRRAVTETVYKWSLERQ